MLTPQTVAAQFVGSTSPLVAWLEDERVTDILINGAQSVYLETEGELRPVANPFKDARAVLDLIERMVVPLGKRVDAAHPYLDGRLCDGSRFHVILAPIAVGGPLVSIRKSRSSRFAPLESFGEPEMIAWLTARVTGGANILIAGGTGAGKTTLLSRLLDEVPENERIAIIEECAEINARHPHAVRLETRAPTPDGAGEVTLRTLIRNALRMRPNRVVLGECRGEEAFDLLQAMNTGHPGSLCTLHANSALDALRRLESLVVFAGINAPLRNVREWISTAVNVVVFVHREDGGRRLIREIVSVQGLEGEVYRIIPRFGARAGQSSAGVR